MTTTDSLPIADRDFALSIFRAVIEASQADSTGHLPNCGYTDDHQDCGCAAWGGRVYRAIKVEVSQRADVSPAQPAAQEDR